LYPLEGLEGMGVLGKVGWQTRYGLRRPGIPHEGERLWFDGTAGIMALDQHGVLLRMVVIASQHHLAETPCWTEGKALGKCCIRSVLAWMSTKRTSKCAW
jgi:hypothetical protein